jgi:hypothetical protein
MKIVILSAYHRSQWLANELKSKGHDVVYLDFSEKLGGLSPEAWIAPFGLYQTKKINYSQNVWLSEGTSTHTIANGFTILAEKGPIEFQGPLNKLSFKRYNIDQDELDYLRASIAMSEEAYEKFKNHFANYSFDETWLLHLSHQLASQTYFENAFAIKNKNRALPMSENWAVRTLSRRGAHETLQMSHDKGVEVYSVHAVQKIKTTSEQLQNITILDAKEKTKEISGDTFINFLSQEELFTILGGNYSDLIAGEPVTSDWFWTSYRFYTNQNDVTEILPQSFCMIEDRFMPWTHHNLMMVHRGQRAHEFIVWVRIPTNYRLKQNLLENVGNDIQRVFSEKFVGIKIRQMELPLECLATEFQVQAPHLPVYSQSKLSNFKLPTQKNFKWCGPEVWERLDTSYLLEYQIQILSQILGEQDNQGIKRRRGRDSEIYS